jgi:hypothetical protein
LRSLRNRLTDVVHFDGHDVGRRLAHGHADRPCRPVLDRVANVVSDRLKVTISRNESF